MLATLLSALTTAAVYLSLLLVGFWIWFRWSHRELLRVAAKLPVPAPTVPFLGHAYLTMWKLEETTRNLLNMTHSALSKGIKVFCIWLGPFPIIYIGHIDDVQVVLNKATKPDEEDRMLAGLDSGVGPFGSSIVIAKGQVWKITKQYLSPVFHPTNLRHMFPIFNTNSRELVARMAEHVGKGPFNVMEYTMDVGLKTVCNIIHGPDIHVDVESESFKGLMRVVELVPELFIRRIMRPWLTIDWLYRLLYRSQLNQMNSDWKNFTEPLLKRIQEKRTQKTYNEGKKESSTDENEGLTSLLDAYSDLQKNHPEFTEADLRTEILGLYCTGTDTIAISTAACLLALAQYPDVQERLYEELISVVGPKNEVTIEDISRMPYLDQVIKETLRKFVIVPYLLRKVTRDINLSTITIPAGSTVVCNLVALHMNPEIYKNPNEFDPERFSPENSTGRERLAFIPFSAGLRVCLAKTYAMHLVKTEIVNVLRNFKLTTTQDIHNLTNKFTVTLRSSEGYNVCVQKRINKNTLDSY